nr:hypothetical protein [Tanacetum cinerariifolium]
MASESTSLKQSQQLIPSSKVNFKKEDGTIGFNNDVAHLEHSNELYQPMLSFLSNYCINKALTLQLFAMNMEYLWEFWASEQLVTQSKASTDLKKKKKKSSSFSQPKSPRARKLTSVCTVLTQTQRYDPDDLEDLYVQWKHYDLRKYGQSETHRCLVYHHSQCVKILRQISDHLQGEQPADLNINNKELALPISDVKQNKGKELVVYKLEAKKPKEIISMEDDSDEDDKELKRLKDLKAKQEKSEQELRKLLNPATLKAQAKKWIEHEAKNAKMMEEYKHQISFKADILPITKIIYVVNSRKEATMKIIQGDNPLNLVVHPNFRLKISGFSERLENQIKVDSEIAREMVSRMNYLRWISAGMYKEYAEVLRRVRGGNTLTIISSSEEEQAELKDCSLK